MAAARPDNLEHLLEEALGEPIAELARLSAGASRESWSLTTSAGGRYVLQRLDRGAARASVQTEAAILRAAGAAGVPVARVIEVFEAGGPLDKPALLLEALPGESLAPRILRHDSYARAREGLAVELGTILARLHSIPVDAVPGLAPMDPITRCYEVLDSLPERHPAFELVLRQLELTRPRSRSQTIVHGDFRLGNLLVDENGVTAVLDWEVVHLGDPLEDLGWPCVPAWRFGGKRPVAGVGSYEELLNAYRSAGGEEVSIAELEWWQTAGTVWWGVLCHVQASRHIGGATRSVELAAIGRRACEQEWDALAMLR